MGLTDSIKKIISSASLYPGFSTREFTFKELEHLIATDYFRGKLAYGIHSKKADYYCMDPSKRPGLAAIGTMGSGKSTAVSFTTRINKITNGDNTFFILIDPSKGMTDYRDMFDEEGIAVAASESNSEGENAAGASKFISMMDIVYNEVMARQYLFNSKGIKATGVTDFEKIAQKNKDAPWYEPGMEKLSRFNIVIEEFHNISQSKKILNFLNNLDREGTAAWQMAQLMRIGRSYGVYFSIATQKGTWEDIPQEIKPGLNLIMAFRVASSADAAAADAPHAQDIPNHLVGRCAVKDGFMQIPFLPTSEYEYLKKKYGKKFEGYMLTTSPEQIKEAANTNGPQALTMIKPYRLIYDNINQFDYRTFVSRIMSEFGFTLAPQKNPALIADLIAERNGRKYAVCVMHDNASFTQKTASALKEVMSILKCESVIGICVGNDSSALESLCEVTNGAYMDEDDMRLLADLLDNKAKFEDQEQYKDRISTIKIAESNMMQSSTKASSEDDIDSDDDDDFEKRVQRMSSRPPRRRMG